MPTYEYACDACGHTWEAFQSIKAEPLTECPSCQAESAKRLISGGGAVLFKGSGFYQTDYRSKSYTDGKKQAEAPPCQGGSNTESACPTCPAKTEPAAKN